MSKINVAIAGIGGCASALIQGIQFYNDNPEFTTGLPYEDIGGYGVTDMKFVVGFDIDERKVGRPLREAIFQLPNCNMRVVDDVNSSVEESAKVYYGSLNDGVAEHMRQLPEEVSFKPADFPNITSEEYVKILKENGVEVLINYMPVGSTIDSKFYIENAIKAGIHVVNCMPSYISTEEAMELENLAIENNVTIVGSDMRSQFGASRLSEVLQGSMLDSGLTVTQHIQMNMAAGTTQGQEGTINGRTANTDFLNMAKQERLVSKHVSKENVLNGQSTVRNKDTAGTTMYAGPSLTVMQKPGGQYIGSDNKIANLDMVAYGWAGARYELTARLSVQDSPNSAGVVADAIRFCKVASEMNIVGYLRGPSAWTQKTPPVQLKSNDAKFECDALARRVTTPMTEKQLANNIEVSNLDYTFQKSKTDYEK